MKKRFIRTKKARYGGMTVLLTVLLVAVIVLSNLLVSTLAKRYSWYVNMNGQADFSVTETCYSLLGGALQGQTEVQIIFCDTEDNLEKEVTSGYVHKTVNEIAARFPESIRVQYHDIWLNPDSVRKYTTTLNPATGEMVDTALKSTNIIIANGDYYRVYDLTEFFVFEGGDTSKLWGYKGERKIAAGLLHAVQNDRPVVCFANNHGEIFYDYEVLYLLDDAGYQIRYIDLYTDPIPEGCRLIISYNPNTDLLDDNVSKLSELQILNDFLSKSGNGFLVFLENGTPKLPNFEKFLAEWGVETAYHTNQATETDYRYMVQDASQSLTSDGYTIYGEPKSSVVSELTRGTVFKKATALRAANGYENNQDGSYSKGNRRLYSLFDAADTAVSWANGAPVDDSRAMLFTLTEQTNADAGVSHVAVCASVDLATEEFLQSAVYGNGDSLFTLFEKLGKANTPKGLIMRPFEASKISTITTAQMWRWTLLLTLIPAVLVTAVGVVVLVKRRQA